MRRETHDKIQITNWIELKSLGFLRQIFEHKSANFTILPVYNILLLIN